MQDDRASIQISRAAFEVAKLHAATYGHSLKAMVEIALSEFYQNHQYVLPKRKGESNARRNR